VLATVPEVAGAVPHQAHRLAEGLDYAFRRAFAKDKGMVAALDAVAKRGDWGRAMPKGTA
jgi:isoquinoline 1-oxidoreductase beta subunit